MDFDWNHARTFLATAKAGSLSAAARQLQITQSTVSRQIAAMEQDLGIALFERIGRGTVLTPAGAKIIDQLSAMQTAADMALLSVEGQTKSLTGTVSISVSDIFAQHVFAAAMPGLRALAPDLIIEIVADNDITDLQRRDADIAVRHVRPTEPELVGKLIGQSPASLYAATSYLARFGRPARLRDYATADFIAIGDPDRMVSYLNPFGLDLTPERFRYVTQNGIVAWQLVQQGLGLMMMSDYVARQTPAVECICHDEIHISFPVWLTAHNEVRSSARIRAVWDYLDDWIKASGLVATSQRKS